jgi:hypothetical protein
MDFGAKGLQTDRIMGYYNALVLAYLLQLH